VRRNSRQSCSYNGGDKLISAAAGTPQSNIRQTPSQAQNSTTNTQDTTIGTGTLNKKSLDINDQPHLHGFKQPRFEQEGREYQHVEWQIGDPFWSASASCYSTPRLQKIVISKDLGGTQLEGIAGITELQSEMMGGVWAFDDLDDFTLLTSEVHSAGNGGENALEPHEVVGTA
jgi:hypothetical protein